MGHTQSALPIVLSRVESHCSLAYRGAAQRDGFMKLLKWQAFRALLALSALASSALVLEAAKRWS
jgi:hypothetical protein